MEHSRVAANIANAAVRAAAGTAPHDPAVWSAEDDAAAFVTVACRAFADDTPLVVYTTEGYEVAWLVTGVEVDGVWGYDQSEAVFAFTLRRLDRYGDLPPIFLPRTRIAMLVVVDAQFAALP